MVSGYSLLEAFPGGPLELLGGKRGSYSFLMARPVPRTSPCCVDWPREPPAGGTIEFGTGVERAWPMAPLVEEAGRSFSACQMRSAGMPESAVKAAHFFSGSCPTGPDRGEHPDVRLLPELEGKFDLVFVDADHEHPGVTIDTRNAFPPAAGWRHSVIVWHDYGDYETVELARYCEGSGRMPDDAHRGRIRHVSIRSAPSGRQDLPAYRPGAFFRTRSST